MTTKIVRRDQRDELAKGETFMSLNLTASWRRILADDCDSFLKFSIAFSNTVSSSQRPVDELHMRLKQTLDNVTT